MASKSIKPRKSTVNPTLKEYFQHMVNAKKLIIQFTQGKIRDIIQNDLDIDFNSFSELSKAVCTEAFVYYIQGWAGWENKKYKQCAENYNIAYDQFKTYLKEKMLNVKAKEEEYGYSNQTEDSVVKNYILEPPNEIYKTLPLDNVPIKIKLPCALEISGTPDCSSYLNFEKLNDEYIFNVKIPKRISNVGLSNVVALNYPFVSVQFNIPLLMKFNRKSEHRIEMFLCKSTDAWSFPKPEKILEVKKYPARTNIYSAKFLQFFFNKLNSVIENYKDSICQQIKEEIACVCNEFLNDVKEADLVFSTIQECADVCYSIGESLYYSDSSTKKDDPINFRKVFFPQIQFSLLFCSIQQSDIRPDGTFKYFDFNTNKQPGQHAELSQTEKTFIENVRQCLSYTCTMCRGNFTTLTSLKKHLLEIHPCSEFVYCTKCKCAANLYQLMGKRWRHTCNFRDPLV